MSIPSVKPPRKEVLACVARFNDLDRCETGLPDMQLPECKRAFYNVLGFSQPKGDCKFSPLGDRAKARVAHLTAGFGVSFIAAEPGKGVLMHTHDTAKLSYDFAKDLTPITQTISTAYIVGSALRNLRNDVGEIVRHQP